ncbi:MAG: hypothetical protein REI64_09660 [Pedobacter sp.]|uniref:hypothetical protein n=1 Tax=Pedobacter sp. TaxID=1411316 RepID=UPI0028098160|nr:hypothetical protein [Pedobacter sp.]MDQ8005052.1 hypothetical protein [Pedobacter sp.]
MRYTIILLLILISIDLLGQNKKSAPIESSNSYKFGRVSYVSFSKRIKNYPFNSAISIHLVSFEDPTNGGQLDTTKVLYNENMPKSYMAACINRFKEVKKLNLIEIDKLTDIWFNYNAIGNGHVSNLGLCYSPRNAILFLNEKGEVFDFIEICFSCLRLKNFSKRIAVEEECDHKINMIKEFFEKAGIKYGVTEKQK